MKKGIMKTDSTVEKVKKQGKEKNFFPALAGIFSR